MSITFETKCWQNDYELMLKMGWLEKMIARNNHSFDARQLIVNNVNNRVEVERLVNKKIKKGVLTHYYFVEDYENEVLKHFNLTKADLGKGYVYSISELTGIYMAQTEYLVHFASDSIPSHNINWIPQAIQMFESNALLKVANLTWNYKYEEAKAESFAENQSFYFGFGFSDQCYLIKPKDFNQKIYHYAHSLSERYPKYGGELFEKKIDAWMRNNKYMRATYKHGSYTHKNVPESFWRKYLYSLTT